MKKLFKNTNFITLCICFVLSLNIISIEVSTSIEPKNILDWAIKEE